MTRNDWWLFLFGVFLGAVLSCLTVLIVNDVRFHAKCDGRVLSDSWGKNYCIQTENLKGNP